MFPSGSKRRKKSREFEILVVPQGDGGGTRSITVSTSKLAFWGSVAASILFLILVFAFRFTPLGALVGAEQNAASANSDTERRILALAEEVAVLKGYNETLRKALGERVEKKETGDTPTQDDVLPTAPNVQSPQVAEPAARMNEHPRERALHVSQASVTATLPLFPPTVGVITRGFAPSENHFGVDFAAKERTPVHAAAKGYIVFSGWTYDDGNVVIISHGAGVTTVYKHNASLLKATGSIVRRGDLIALVGSTGQSCKGPHLHFEVLRDGIPQDPAEHLLITKSQL